MAHGWIHTEYRAGRWTNRVEDGAILSSHASQAEAKVTGRAEARRRHTTHVVHRIDGSVVESRSFPSPPHRAR